MLSRVETSSAQAQLAIRAAIKAVRDLDRAGRGAWWLTGGIRRPTGSPSGPQERAHGGPVRKGVPYVVGEHHEEVFIPDQNGTIDPRAPIPVTGGAVGGSGSPVLATGSDATAQAILRALEIGNVQRAALVAQEPHAARPMTARGQLARDVAMMPGGRL